MKKCILSAIAGALAMFMAITAAAGLRRNKEQAPEIYKHIDYVSAITPEECYVCGDVSGFEGSLYWGEDNVGIVNLNTFQLLRLEINRYDERGNLMKQPAGRMTKSGMFGLDGESRVYARCHPDGAYAHVRFFGVRFAVEREEIRNHLCQTCLDQINSQCFTDRPPAEYGVISFKDRRIYPLINPYVWFPAGNYGIGCEFEEDGMIDLLIHYIGPRYE